MYSSSTDLFAYFYEKAVELCREGGLFGYITNSFAKTTGAGSTLRGFLAKNTRFRSYIDFNTLTIFEDATTYPIILVAEKSDHRENFDYLYVQEDELYSLETAVQTRRVSVSQEKLNDSGWSFFDVEVSALMQSLGTHPSIKSVYGKSYRGILTGLNAAFVISGETRTTLLTKDPGSNELIRPLWEGKDLQRWYTDQDSKFVIYISQGLTKSHFGELPESQALDKMEKAYPAVFKHLREFEAQARNRYDKGDYWWEMRACAYEHRFPEPKIVWPNLQNRGKFCADTTGKYINAPAVFLPTDSKALLGILNSKMIWLFLKDICVVRSGGYLEVKPQYFEQIPVPNLSTSEFTPSISRCADRIVRRTRESQEISKRFRLLIVSAFLGEKLWPARLTQWWELDFAEFVKALRVKLTLRQKDELLPVFEKYKAELSALDAEIQRLEREIDQLVYDLYELTPEEIALVEASV